jgi:hypothetical protein
MARLRSSKGRYKGESGYARMIGDKALGDLLSKCHATTIRAGNELEKIVLERSNQILDLDEFLARDIHPDGVWVASKRIVRKSRRLDTSKYEPDFVIFRRKAPEQRCYIVELKDGDAFDTKKSAGEAANLREFLHRIAPEIRFEAAWYMCCFHASSKEGIVHGFKSRITKGQALTGREFCQLLEIDFDEIVEMRRRDAADNLAYFIDQILAIEASRAAIEERLGGFVDWDNNGGEGSPEDVLH